MSASNVSLLHETSRQVAAGGSAGLVEICLMHPLDVVKTRFQVQRSITDPQSYRTVRGSFQMIFRTEGLFGFYKGIIPPILAETPKRAVKFSTFELYKKFLGYMSLSPGLVSFPAVAEAVVNIGPRVTWDKNHSVVRGRLRVFYWNDREQLSREEQRSYNDTAQTFLIAGLGSGLTEAVVVNPFEVVKVGLQVNRNLFKEQPSTFAYARQIIKKEGLGFQGLNKGLTATLGRHGIFNMVYFGFYHNVKNIIPSSKDPTLEFLRKFGIGFVSGTMGSVFNIPFDVAKSRIQGPQPVPGEIKYRSCFKTMEMIYREEGILALYKGLVPKVMRLGPGGGVMLLVYEYTYAWLQEHW